jgi:hypothetical protein
MEQLMPRDEDSQRKVGSQPDSQTQREAEIERLAGEIGRLIQASDIKTREELAEIANSLLREQGLRMDPAAVDNQIITDARRRPLNPLAAGIGLIMVGAAVTLVVPFVGLTLAACGVLAAFWGVMISMLRK